MKKMAYITHDNVNEAFVASRAEAAGATMEPLTLRDPLPNGQFERVLIDWDALDDRGREGLLAGLLAEPWAGRLGLTSYGITEEDAEVLRRKGVNVFGRLEPDALKWLIEGEDGQANSPGSSGREEVA
jgi:hypothetical protein